MEEKIGRDFQRSILSDAGFVPQVGFFSHHQHISSPYTPWNMKMVATQNMEVWMVQGGFFRISKAMIPWFLRFLSFSPFILIPLRFCPRLHRRQPRRWWRISPQRLCRAWPNLQAMWIFFFRGRWWKSWGPCCGNGFLSPTISRVITPVTNL